MFLIILASVLLAQTQALTMNCVFSEDNGWVIVGDVYTCGTQFTGTSENDRTVTRVSGNHLAGKGDLDVKALYIWGRQLTHLPGDIDSFFPNLVVLSLSNTGLSSITSEDLQPFPSLVVFGADESKISSLDGNLFMFTLHLQVISMQNNLITNVGDGLLNDLHELTGAHFRKNICINQFAMNRGELPALINSFRINCPPLETAPTTVRPSTSVTPPTSEEKCPAECLERIQFLEKEAYDHKKVLEMHEERLNDLEKKIREINASPRLN